MHVLPYKTSEEQPQHLGSEPGTSLLERLSWTEKLPAAFGFGCLLGLSSPGYDLWWIAWFGLVPLLVMIFGCKGKLEASVQGLAFGLGYNLVTLRWLLGLYPLRWLGFNDWLGFQSALCLWLLESLHHAVLFAAFALMVFALPMRAGVLPHHKRPLFPYILSVPLLWLFFQWVIGPAAVFLGTPVNALAYSQSKLTDLIQIARLGGAQVIDFLLVMANAALAAATLELTNLARRLPERVDLISSRGGTTLDLALVAIVLASIVWWGDGQVKRLTMASSLVAQDRDIFSPPVPLAVTQCNIAVEDERLHAMAASEIAQRYTSLAHEPGVALLVLPEGALSPAQKTPGLLLSQLKSLAHVEKKESIAGTIEVVGTSQANAAVLVNDRGETESLYVKRRLLPFVESMPVGPASALVPRAIKALLTGSGEGFIASGKTTLLNNAFGKVGVSIGTEILYPKLISDEVRHGASLLVNISNLAWFHDSPLGKQVLAAAVLRAVENGRYLVLASNTGVSAVVTPAGVVSSESFANKKGVLIDTVQFLYNRTPYSKMWWL